MATTDSMQEPMQTRLLTEVQAAKYLGYTPRALQNWRYKGGGPAFIKISATSIRYDINDLDEYVCERRIKSTCEWKPNPGSVDS